MRDIPQALIDALEERTVRPVMLVEIEFDTPLRFSSAYGELTVGGKTYVGGGNLGSVGGISEHRDLEPQSLDISFSGISDAVLNAVLGGEYLNRSVTVLVVFYDQSGNQLADTMTYFIGKTDEVKVNHGKQSLIRVTARNRLADWQRPRIERNVNSDQQSRYPGDKGFEFVSQVAGANIIWPKGAFFE